MTIDPVGANIVIQAGLLVAGILGFWLSLRNQTRNRERDENARFEGLSRDIEEVTRIAMQNQRALEELDRRSRRHERKCERRWRQAWKQLRKADRRIAGLEASSSP